MAYVLIATDNSVNKYKGNSIDTKPSDVPNGSRCFETDTRRVWVYDSSHKNPGTNTNWWPDYVDQEDFLDLLNDTVNDAQLGDIAQQFPIGYTPTIADIKIADGVIANYTYTNNIFSWSNRTQGDYVIPYVLCDNYNKTEFTYIAGAFFIVGINKTVDPNNTTFLVFGVSGATVTLSRLKILKSNGNNSGLTTIKTITNANSVTISANDVITAKYNNGCISVYIARSNTIYNLIANINLATVDSYCSYNFAVGLFDHTNTHSDIFKNLTLTQNGALNTLPSTQAYKIGNFVGDSITAGSNGGTSYIATVQSLLNLSGVVNNGTGGVTVGGLIGVANAAITDDFILVFAGTNDFGGNTTLGVLGDTVNGESFYGTFYSLLQRFSTYSPHIPIGVITPIPRFDITTNTNNNTLEQFTNAIVQTCQVLGIPCLDLYHESGYNSFNYTDFYLADKVHQTALGASRIGRKIAEFINTKVL